MDRKQNPFAPGAGTRPPELAGRDRILEDAGVALARVKAARPAKGQMLLGLRGVGKTVLLNEIARMAEQDGYRTIELEAPEDQRLAAMLVPPLRLVLNRLSAIEKATTLATRALRALQSFSSTFKVKVGEVELGVKDPAAMSGNLETDLPALLLIVAQAAQAADTPVAILIDEVQYLLNEDLSALLVSMHRIGQRPLPLILFGAGLPQLAALAGDARLQSERVGRPSGSSEKAAGIARQPTKPASIAAEREAQRGPRWRPTRERTYFLQEWGSHAWDVAPRSPITEADVVRATESAMSALDRGFFRVRLDRLTPRERDYLRAMAELGPGPHRSGDVAATLGADVTAVAPLRSGLIKEGDGLQHGAQGHGCSRCRCSMRS